MELRAYRTRKFGFSCLGDHVVEVPFLLVMDVRMENLGERNVELFGDYFPITV